MNSRIFVLAAVFAAATGFVVSCNEAAVKTERPVVSQGGSGPGTGAGGSGGGITPMGTVTLPDAAPSGPDAPGRDQATCVPATCTPAGGKYCGVIGDGCGGKLDCGATCPAGQSCGGGGVEKLCGVAPDPSCKPIPCNQMGGRLCGRVGDGCGRAQECGDCPAGDTCGAKQPNVCGQGSAEASCDNLCKQQVVCPAGGSTTVSGTVFAPTPMRFGKADPLYNALVYVPNRPLQPFAAGVSCDQCGGAVSGAPLVNALSGPDGKFTLRNVPAGDAIPLVIQIGRWRREVVIPKVTACSNTELPAELTRLPRNAKEGNIPQMAIATGTYDPFECLLRKVGIDEAEFTAPTGAGRVHVYKFDGLDLAQPVPPGTQLVGSPTNLAKYDIVLLPCDSNDDRPMTELANVRDYTNKGGRLFLTDWAYVWLRDGGAFQQTASWLLPDTQLNGMDFQTLVDEGFPKGQAFAEWLQIVGASTMRGRLPVHDPYEGDSYITAVNSPTQRWLSTAKAGSKVETVQHFTFNTPIGSPADKQCGRVVYSNFHVAAEKANPVIGPDLRGVFPQSCSNSPMTPQERALEFMLFDATACVLPDKEKPQVFTPPPPAPPPPPPELE